MANEITHPLNWFREADWDHHRAVGENNRFYEFYSNGKGFTVILYSPFKKLLGTAKTIEEAMEIGSKHNSENARVHLQDKAVHIIKCVLCIMPIIGAHIRKDAQYSNIYRDWRLRKYK